ncbi:MAG: hypothetical protein EXQ58_05340 [Acidobacteria bacterium]|nr:hypothetical protein [Acidobacteriota bacterium]
MPAPPLRLSAPTLNTFPGIGNPQRLGGGFSTRYWLLGDHDSVMAYLSKAMWNPTITADEVTRDQVRSTLGDACVDDMLAVFDEVEAATEISEWNSLSFMFPVPKMVTQF